MTTHLAPLQRLAFLAALALAGCASVPSYKAAGCNRFRFEGYAILACNDDAVGQHCKRKAPLTDLGEPVTYHPRACHIPGKSGRKAAIVIGESYMACLPHEICHQENPGNPAKCEREYPCVGDKRTAFLLPYLGNPERVATAKPAEDGV